MNEWQALAVAVEILRCVFQGDELALWGNQYNLERFAPPPAPKPPPEA